MPVAAPERRTRAPDDAVTDAELVDRARAGDDDAYAAIYVRHVGAVRDVARARLGPQGDPADVVQETFTAAWHHLDGLRQPERLRPWLLQIAARAAIDHGRRYRRASNHRGEVLLEEVEDPGPSPDDAVALGILVRQVNAGIDNLCRRDATVIALAAHLGFGSEEIAEALGVTPGNAKVILHRARGRLRASLAPDTDPPVQRSRSRERSG